MKNVNFYKGGFFKNAIFQEDTSSHKLICEFDTDVSVSTDNVLDSIYGQDGIGTICIESICDGEIDNVYYGYSVVDLIESVKSDSKDFSRYKVTFRQPTIEEFIPMMCKFMVDATNTVATTEADLGGVYAQITSDFRQMMIRCL